MTKIEVQLHENVIDIFNKIKNIDDVGIELEIPRGAVIFDNVLNIKLLKKIFSRESKELTIKTQGDHENNILDIAEEKYVEEKSNYIKYEGGQSVSKKLTLPKLDITKLKMAFSFKPSLPKFKIKVGGLIIIPLFIGILTFLGYLTLNSIHKANVKIEVESKILSRSITIDVIKDEINNFEDNIIKGYEVQQSFSSKETTQTTGEKVVGEKAKGTITIYNRTAETKKFEKGEVVIFKDDDDDEYKYVFTDDVEVDSRIEDDTDPEEPMIPGEKEVEIEAVEIGDDYNFSKDETLKFDDYDSSDFIAKSSSDIKGGSTETIKIVSEDDILDLQQKVNNKNNEEVIKLLEEGDTQDRKYIKGTQNIVVVSNEFNNEINEETEELELEQRVTATGLSYSLDDLNNLVNNNIQNLAPEGYEIIEQDTQLNVEVLNSESTDTAQLQVTVRLFITPKIDTEELKMNFKGKSIEEVQEIINNLNDIKTYQLYIYPNISFFNKFPKDINKIEVNVERE